MKIWNLSIDFEADVKEAEEIQDAFIKILKDKKIRYHSYMESNFTREKDYVIKCKERYFRSV